MCVGPVSAMCVSQGHDHSQGRLCVCCTALWCTEADKRNKKKKKVDADQSQQQQQQEPEVFVGLFRDPTATQ